MVSLTAQPNKYQKYIIYPDIGSIYPMNEQALPDT